MCQLITVYSAYELLLATLIIIHATAATVAVWWMPRILHQRLDLGTTDTSAPVTEIRFPGRPLHQSNSAFWWKLAFIAAIVNFAALPVWMFRYTGRWPAAIPISLIVPITVFFSLPVLYLAVFSFWHWRTRYAGRHHLAWLILFIIAERPFVQLFPGMVFIALAYCAIHLVPDARQMMKAEGVSDPSEEHLRSGFIVEGMSFMKLFKSIPEIDGVTFTDRRHFFWWSDQIKAEFTFQGNQFTILPDPWDDALWVQVKTDGVDSYVTLPIQKHIAVDANNNLNPIENGAPFSKG